MDDTQGKSEKNDVFRKRYRVSSARLTGWDYSSSFNGAYFVTICTKDREHFFGQISGGIMRNSFLGDVADACWRTIPEHFPWIITDEFVVMPNHIHGILFFKGGAGDVAAPLVDAETQTENKNNRGETQDFASLPLQASLLLPLSPSLSVPLPSQSETQTGKEETQTGKDETQMGNETRVRYETQTGDETQNLASLQGEREIREMRGTGNIFGPQCKNLASVIRGFKVGVTKCARKEGLYFFWQPRFYDRVIRNENELNQVREYIFSNPKNWEYDSENAFRVGNKMTG